MLTRYRLIGKGGIPAPFYPPGKEAIHPRPKGRGILA